jgi:hypothetical protein
MTDEESVPEIFAYILVQHGERVRIPQCEGAAQPNVAPWQLLDGDASPRRFGGREFVGFPRVGATRNGFRMEPFGGLTRDLD